MTRTEYLTKIKPFLDRFVEIPEEYYLLKVFADELDALDRPMYATWLRDWKPEYKPKSRHAKLWETGTPIFLTHTARCWHVELWAILLEVRSEVPVDWSYTGGRARIVADLKSHEMSRSRIEVAVNHLMPLLRYYFNLEAGELCVEKGQLPGGRLL